MHHPTVTRLIDAGYPAVMGTGIVSVTFAADGHELIARVLLAVAAILYVGLAPHFRATPAAVAATVVLGTRATQRVESEHHSRSSRRRANNTASCHSPCRR